MQKLPNDAKSVTPSCYVNHWVVLWRTKGNVYLNKHWYDPKAHNDTILSLSILDHGILVVADLFLLLWNKIDSSKLGSTCSSINF